MKTVSQEYLMSIGDVEGKEKFEFRKEHLWKKGQEQSEKMKSEKSQTKAYWITPVAHIGIQCDMEICYSSCPHRIKEIQNIGTQCPIRKWKIFKFQFY